MAAAVGEGEPEAEQAIAELLLDKRASQAVATKKNKPGDAEAGGGNHTLGGKGFEATCVPADPDAWGHVAIDGIGRRSASAGATARGSGGGATVQIPRAEDPAETSGRIMESKLRIAILNQLPDCGRSICHVS